MMSEGDCAGGSITYSRRPGSLDCQGCQWPPKWGEASCFSSSSYLPLSPLFLPQGHQGPPVCLAMRNYVTKHGLVKFTLRPLTFQ